MADFVDEVFAGLKDDTQHFLGQFRGECLNLYTQQAGGFVVVGGNHALVVLQQVFARCVLVQPEEYVAALGCKLLDPVHFVFEQQHHVHRRDVFAQVKSLFPRGRVGACQQGSKAWHLRTLIVAILAYHHLGGADKAVSGK
ncbi:hypothetical protein D3C79_808640 [compost metagenome]